MQGEWQTTTLPWVSRGAVRLLVRLRALGGFGRAERLPSGATAAPGSGGVSPRRTGSPSTKARRADCAGYLVSRQGGAAIAAAELSTQGFRTRTAASFAWIDVQIRFPVGGVDRIRLAKSDVDRVRKVQEGRIADLRCGMQEGPLWTWDHHNR